MIKFTIFYFCLCITIISFAQNDEQKELNGDFPQSWFATIQNELENKGYNISFDEITQTYQNPNRLNNIRAYYNSGRLSLQNRMGFVGQNCQYNIQTEAVSILDKSYSPYGLNLYGKILPKSNLLLGIL